MHNQEIFRIFSHQAEKKYLYYTSILRSATCFGLFFEPSSGITVCKSKYVHREILFANMLRFYVS